MKTKKVFNILLFIFLMSFIAGPGTVQAMSVGTAANNDLSLALKQALQQKREFTRKNERTKTLAVYALYLPYLAEMERTIPYFRKCGIATNPKTLNYFIHSPVHRQGIDLYALEYMQKMGEIGGKNKMLRQARIKRYMTCIASYGLILAAAFHNFGDVVSGGSGLTAETYNVSSNQFYNMVAASLVNGIKYQSQRLRTAFKNIKSEIKDNTCVLYGKQLKCGGVYLSIDGSPKLSWGGLDWFNPQADFAGQNDVIVIGYGQNSDYSATQSKDRAINYVDSVSNSIASDILTGGLF